MGIAYAGDHSVFFYYYLTTSFFFNILGLKRCEKQLFNFGTVCNHNRFGLRSQKRLIILSIVLASNLLIRNIFSF